MGSSHNQLTLCNMLAKKQLYKDINSEGVILSKKRYMFLKSLYQNLKKEGKVKREKTKK